MAGRDKSGPLKPLFDEFIDKLTDAMTTKAEGFSTFADELREMGASDRVVCAYIGSLIRGNLNAEIQVLLTGKPKKKIDAVMDVLEKSFGEKRVKRVLRARERRKDSDEERMIA